LGFAESAVFPEIDPGKVDKIQGLEVSIVTTAKDNKEGCAFGSVGNAFCKELIWQKFQTLLNLRKNRNLKFDKRTDVIFVEDPEPT
jgi:hypothetical protein